MPPATGIANAYTHRPPGEIPRARRARTAGDSFPAYRLSDARSTPIDTIGRAVDLRRRGFAVVENDLVAGACPQCATRLAGIGLTRVGAS